jgi:hypothetical protein
VQDLPLEALKRLLTSDELKMTSENETFWLIKSWVEHQVSPGTGLTLMRCEHPFRSR